MSRAIDLRLKPACTTGSHSIEVEVYTYDPEGAVGNMAESVYLGANFGVGFFNLDLTVDEARVLANQLMQVADQAVEHRARREHLEEIEEQLRDPDVDASLVTHVHPDVMYVEPGQLSVAALAHPGKLLIARAA